MIYTSKPCAIYNLTKKLKHKNCIQSNFSYNLNKTLFSVKNDSPEENNVLMDVGKDSNISLNRILILVL